MKPRRISTSYQKDEKFTLTVEEYSKFRSVTSVILDTILCKPFGHRFGWQFEVCNALMHWEYRAVTQLVEIPISREDADKINPNSWGWLDDE